MSVYKAIYEYARGKGTVTRQELITYLATLKPELHPMSVKSAVTIILSFRKKEDPYITYITPYYFTKDGDKFTYHANKGYRGVQPYAK
jgi:hypothetical protein